MLVDLVRTTTRDGVRLDGLFRPRTIPAPAVDLDGVCLVHGTGGNFYSSTLFDDLTDPLLVLGVGVLRVNTRGHDGISTAVTPQGGRRLGAAYEVLDHCRHDLTAWVGWLREHAGPRVGLLGHSSGAVKALYVAAHEAHLDPACVLAVSPPRLSYSWFCSSPEGPEFLRTYQEAQAHADAGRPAALMEVKLPLPFVITAAGYLEKYGPDERYNYVPLLDGVHCPTLITYGSVEVENNMAFRGAPAEVTARGRRFAGVRAEIVPGADHFYTGARAELAAVVEGWLRIALAPPARG